MCNDVLIKEIQANDSCQIPHIHIRTNPFMFNCSLGGSLLQLTIMTDMSKDAKLCFTHENHVTPEIIIFHNFCARVSQTALVSRILYVPGLYVICKLLDAGLKNFVWSFQEYTTALAH